MNQFLTLMRREYWEHRGGLVRAQFWTVVILTVLLIFGVLMATVLRNHFTGTAQIGGFNPAPLVNGWASQHLEQWRSAFATGMMTVAMLPQGVALIVVFFYCIGALYDDRRDRSILFWKSMPVSDISTVLSKVVTAMVVAPVACFAAAMVLHLCFLTVLTITALAYGLDVWTLVLSPSALWKVWPLIALNMVAQVAWMAPMVGWLLLASSFAKSKAFLWAVLTPVAFGTVWSLAEIYTMLSLPKLWVWTHIVGRVLPIGISAGDRSMYVMGLRYSEESQVLSTQAALNVFTDVETWLGLIAAALMIAGAIWLRRTRELAD